VKAAKLDTEQFRVCHSKIKTKALNPHVHSGLNAGTSPSVTVSSRTRGFGYRVWWVPKPNRPTCLCISGLGTSIEWVNVLTVAAEKQRGRCGVLLNTRCCTRKQSTTCCSRKDKDRTRLETR